MKNPILKFIEDVFGAPSPRRHTRVRMRRVMRRRGGVHRKIRHAAFHGRTHGSFKMYQEKALSLAQSRAEHFNAHYKFPYKTIRVKNQQTRWGSCSRNKNINFNYRIALLDPLLADYVIVHELCHLQELNHSAKFWALVQETLPNYKELRKQLKSIPIT